MKLEYEQLNSLPPLAWLANINKGTVKVLHGKNVESHDTFFVEGAWNGDFSSAEFVESEWFCGTGAKIVNNTIRFSTPSHVTAGLFVFSNSGG